MIHLTPTDSLTIYLALVPTAACPFQASYEDEAPETEPGGGRIATADVNCGTVAAQTPGVTLLAAPTVGIRKIKSISVYNADIAAVTVTIRLMRSGAAYILGVQALALQETLVITGDTWHVVPGAASGVTNGDSHDHAGGDGAQINHTGLSNIGTNTHAQIDTHVAAAAPHSGHAATAHKATHEPAGSDPMTVDAAAATGSLRTLGTGAAQACAGNDTRLADSRAPTGAAGGMLAGTYPNPTHAVWSKVLAQLAASQNVLDSTATDVLWDTEVTDSLNEFGSPTFSPTVTGRYLFEGTICWTANAAGHRQIYLRNALATTLHGGSIVPVNSAGTQTRQTFAFVLDLMAGDIVKVAVVQNSGLGAPGLAIVGGAQTTHLTITRLT